MRSGISNQECLPLRQGSFCSDAALLRTKTHSESQNIFNEVLDQLTVQDESLPRQTSLYTLPSMNFLESLLDEMDSRNASMGLAPLEPPVFLPEDSLDLPGLDFPVKESLEELGLESSSITNKMAYSCPTLQQGPSSESVDATHLLSESATLRRSPFFCGAFAPTAGSAAPSPQKDHSNNQMRSARVSSFDEYDNLEDDYEMSLQTSKSGRCRKVSNFVSGKKRKSHAVSQYSAPAELVRHDKIIYGERNEKMNVCRDVEVASAQVRKLQKSMCLTKNISCISAILHMKKSIIVVYSMINRMCITELRIFAYIQVAKGGQWFV